MKFRQTAISALLLAMTSGYAHSAATPEYRAIQVHTWIPGMLSPAEIDETVKWAKDANMNLVILQARRVADAVYNSAYEPRGDSIEGPPGFDPLGYGIKKCRENGLQVYAWFNVYRVWGGGKPSDPKHVVNQHPEWLNRSFDGKTASGDGVYLDPGVPEVREYTVKVLADLLSKYDVDGIMLDFVRYPNRDWGYSDIAVARFNKQYNRTGKPDPRDLTWGRWRREQVTEMVRAMYKEINRQKPHVVFSAATIPWGPCATSWTRTDAFAWVFQDWRLWMEQGILDVNMPMNYKDPSKTRDQGWYVDWVDGMKKWSYGRHAISIAMVMKNNVDGAVEQIRLAREHGLPGAGGFAFSQTSRKAELAAALKAKVYKEPAPVPVCPWKTKPPKPKCGQ
jgi:uncharacterized lipoprotein YddW (UPF0748 family)